MVKNLIALLGVAVLVCLVAAPAEAQFRTTTVVNPPGLFNRSVVRTNSNFIGGGGFNQVAVGRGFNNTAVAFNGGFITPTAFVGSGPAVFVNNNAVRFNAFGTSTVQDAFGNVFQVDAFGNSALVGNRLGISALGSGFVPTAVNFGAVPVGFNSVNVRSGRFGRNSVQVNSFGGGGGFGGGTVVNTGFGVRSVGSCGFRRF